MEVEATDGGVTDPAMTPERLTELFTPVVQRLSTVKGAWIFTAPVDPSEWGGLEDYFEVRVGVGVEVGLGLVHVTLTITLTITLTKSLTTITLTTITLLPDTR